MAAGVEAAVVVTVRVVVASVEVKVVVEVEMETPSIRTVVTVCHAVTVTLGVTVEMEVCGSQHRSLRTWVRRRARKQGEKRTNVSVTEPAVAVTVTVLAGTLMQRHALVIRSGEYDTHLLVMHRGGSAAPTETERFGSGTETLGVTVVVVVSVSVIVAVAVVVVTVVDDASVAE